MLNAYRDETSPGLDIKTARLAINAAHELLDRGYYSPAQAQAAAEAFQLEGFLEALQATNATPPYDVVSEKTDRAARLLCESLSEEIETAILRPNQPSRSKGPKLVWTDGINSAYWNLTQRWPDTMMRRDAVAKAAHRIQQNGQSKSR